MARENRGRSLAVPDDHFSAFFTQATGNPPYPYQRRLDDEPAESCLIHVPTGFGDCGLTVVVESVRRNNSSVYLTGSSPKYE